MVRTTFRLSAVWIASVLLLVAPLATLRADSQQVKDIRENPLLEEVTPTQEAETQGWQSIYQAYGSVYHHSYALASRWLMYALKEGAGDQLLKSRYDISYLAKGLTRVAAERHEVAVPESSCDAQVLQGLMQEIVGGGVFINAEAVDTLKRVALNNPTYLSLRYLQAKIRAMEFEMSGDPWLTPPDVAQTGGKSKPYFKMENGQVSTEHGQTQGDVDTIDASVRPFIFSYRKTGADLMTGRTRQAFLGSIRPTGDSLPGYSPSYAVMRVQEEDS